MELQFPEDIQRDEVKIVGRVVALQGSSERAAVVAKRPRPRIHQFPRGTCAYVGTDVILDACAVTELTIDGKDNRTILLRNRRTVIRETRGPEPFLGQSVLLADRQLISIGEMQIGLDRPLSSRGNSDRKLAKG
jgi:hypothetical protein